MSNDIANYEIGISFKSAIRDIKKFRKIADDFNRKLAKDQKAGRKIESDNTRHLISEKKKQGKASQTALAGMLREEHKAAAAKDKLLAKEKAQQKRFNTWRKSQQRRLIDSQLDQHQKMEIMRILSTTRAEHEIRSLYDETLRKFRANKLKEVQAAKAADKLRVDSEKSTNARMAKLKAGAFAAAQVAAAAVTAGAAVIGMGGKQYKDDKANAANAGMDTETYQRKSYVASNSTNLDKDMIADVWQDVNDKIGSKHRLTRDKNGKIGGGDAGLIDQIEWIEMQQGRQMSQGEIDTLFSGDADEVLTKLNAKFDEFGADIKTKTQLFESLSSNSWKLTSQMLKNSEAVKQAEADFKRLGLGIQDLESVDRVTAAFSRMWGVLSQAPLEAFEAFSKALNPSTTAVLQQLSEKLVGFSRVIGELFAGALNMLAPHLEKVMVLFEKLTPLFSYIANSVGASLTLLFDVVGVVVDSLNTAVTAITQIVNGDFSGAMDTMVNGIKGIFEGIGNAIQKYMLGMLDNIISFLPDWAVPDSLKKMVTDGKQKQAEQATNATTTGNTTASNPTATTTPTQTPSATQQATNSPATRAPSANSGGGVIQVQNSTNVTLSLDGSTIAQQVVRSDYFKTNVRQMAQYGAGGNR